MKDEKILKVTSLIKRFGSRKVLDEIDFSINEGEFFTIIGPSGAGKTTLLKIIGILLETDKGRIHFKGKERDASSILENDREGIVMVFQNPIMFNCSVYDNLVYGLKIRKKPDWVIKKELRKILGIVRIKDLKRNALTLSGGEIQRVSLARALMTEPKLLLLDEPTAHLDPHNVANIESILKKVNKEMGITIILSTHNINQAKRLSDRLMLLIDGKVVEISENDEFFNDPKSIKTKKFLKGEMIY